MATTTWQPRWLLAAILMVGLTTSVAAKSGDVYFENFADGSPTATSRYRSGTG